MINLGYLCFIHGVGLRKCCGKAIYIDFREAKSYFVFRDGKITVIARKTSIKIPNIRAKILSKYARKTEKLGKVIIYYIDGAHDDIMKDVDAKIRESDKRQEKELLTNNIFWLATAIMFNQEKNIEHSKQRIKALVKRNSNIEAEIYSELEEEILRATRDALDYLLELLMGE